MTCRIAFSREVRRQIGDLPGHIKALAKQEIAGLSDNSRPPQGKELTGHPTYFRLWLGRDYRLARIGHRADGRDRVRGVQDARSVRAPGTGPIAGKVRV